MNRRKAALAVQGVVSLGLLGFLFRSFEWSSLWQILRSTPAWYYLASFGALSTGQLLYAYRWQLVLRALGVKVAFPQLVEQYFIAIFFNNFLPSAVGGDLSRAYHLGRRQGFAGVGTSVLLDRALGFFSLAAWGTVILWCLNFSAPGFPVARHVLTMIFLLLLAAVLMVLRFPLGPLAGRLGRVSWLVPMARVLDLSEEYMRLFRQRPLVALPVMAIVFVYFLLLAAVYWTYFWLSTGQWVPYWPVMAILMSIGILSNLPISINGVGLREQLHYLLFASLNLSKELAVAISLVVFSQLLLLSLLGYGLWLRMRVREASKPTAADCRRVMP